MEPGEILSYFEGRRDATVAAIREIVEIESPSFDMERSRAVADWLENAFGNIDIDLTIERASAEGCGEHLIVRAFPGEQPPVLLLGHTDTVHPVGTRERNPTR